MSLVKRPDCGMEVSDRTAADAASSIHGDCPFAHGYIRSEIRI